MADGTQQWNKVEFIHGINSERSVFIDNIRANTVLGLKEFRARKALVVGGGPSAADYLDDIRERSQDWEIWAINGAHDWLLSHSIVPHHAVIMDANPVIDKCIARPLPGITYWLASQTYQGLVRRFVNAWADIRLWHASLDDEAHELMGADATIMSGCNTAGLHSLQILLMQGVRKVRVYGLDSSYRDGQDHAYLNTQHPDAPQLFLFRDKRYSATGTMAAQAKIFCDLYPRMFQAGMKIEVLGDGLLPDMWRARHEKLMQQIMQLEASRNGNDDC